MTDKIKPGFKVLSGYEELEKVKPDTWLFTGEDGVQSVHTDAEASELLADYFPGTVLSND